MKNKKIKTTKSILKFGIACATMAVVAAGCEKAQDISPSPSSSSMTVKMTDNPADYAELDVKITRVEAWSEVGGWVTLNDQLLEVNVLSLTNGAEVFLAQNSGIEAGIYSKVRVTFDPDARLVLNTGASLLGVELDPHLKLGWEGPTAIEIPIDEQVNSGATAEVLLDFDVAASIVQHGDKYYIKPMVREVKNIDTGLQGKVHGAAYAAIAVNNAHGSWGTFANSSGEFLLRGLEPGVYDVTIFQSDDPLQGQNNPKETEIKGVVIVKGEIKQLGNIGL